ncbi:arabidopsis Inositol phosphorylceramide synthase3 [Striga asiatica]|uniref:Arabidopsis Inositol phosphorylceramide synthase3 n=1 Tax=Striga asiatica TaxID=4170 RepID=A0A5A7RJA7_STRAF|nr:arabidopsis Inositol phosphorylceramide synthase3 [Striga asiatica]
MALLLAVDQLHDVVLHRSRGFKEAMEESMCRDHYRNQPSCRKLEVHFRGISMDWQLEEFIIFTGLAPHFRTLASSFFRHTVNLVVFFVDKKLPEIEDSHKRQDHGRRGSNTTAEECSNAIGIEFEQKPSSVLGKISRLKPVKSEILN